MATDSQIVKALKRAAEALLGRSLKVGEEQQIIDRFNKASGTHREKAIKSLEGVTGLSDSEIRTKTAASDDADRKIRDLQNSLDTWKPGT